MNTTVVTDEPAPIIGEFASPGIDLLSVSTLVLWLGCLAVGVFGFVMPYTRPHAPKPVVAAPVEILSVELTPDMMPPNQQLSTANTVTPSDAMVQPEIPPPVAVARPPAAIAFALPVESPNRIVAGTPTRLVFGEGEGKQPAPEYPLRARREGEEGLVNVRFTVDEAGRVRSAEVAQSSPWPLLNESAVNTIRERWHFKPGAVRAYEVSIRFELTR